MMHHKNMVHSNLKLFNENFSTSFKYSKDVSSLSNGLYFLTIKTNNFSQTIKFIKQQ